MPTTERDVISISAPAPPERRDSPRDYVRALARRWKILAGFVIVAVSAAAVTLALSEKRYVASTDVLITPISASDETFVGFTLLREGVEQARSVVTATRIMRSPEIAREARREFGPSNRASVTIEPIGQSNIVSIRATAPSPEEAATAANTYAETAIDVRTRQFQEELTRRIDQLRERLAGIEDREANFEAAALEQRLAELGALVGAPDPTMTILSRAEPPISPSWPRPKLTIAIALIASLLLGAGIAIAFELIDPRIAREETLVVEHGLPVIARIPRLRRSDLRNYRTGDAPLPPHARKAYRTLRANIATAGTTLGPAKTITVTSAGPGDGKTMAAVNLALTAAAAGSRVILVDGDMHRPRIAPTFRVTTRRDGLARVLRGEIEPLDALVATHQYGPELRLLLCGPEHAVLMHRLETDRVTAILDALSADADMVIIDSPPIPEVAEAIAYADAAEAVLVCVRLGHTRRDRLDDLRRMLAFRGIAPLGFVLTSRDPNEGAAYGYGYEADGEPEREVLTTERQRVRASGDARRTRR